ncbi:MAG: S8 family serine peptidase [Acidimicrobiales bacterium]|nr:S8 family serine peptidase [Acidimicrobiales bacterium]
MPEPGEHLTHLLVVGQVEDREFTRQGRGDRKIRDVERRAHGEAMQREVESALAVQDQAHDEGSLEELEALGVIVTIEASPGFPLSLDSLEQMSRHRDAPRPRWLLLSVSPETEDSPERALVWISDEYRETFLRLFEDYLDSEKDTPGGKPRNRALIANMARIRATVLRDLWQSDGDPPTTGLHWWEIWLRPEPDAVDLAQEYATRVQLRIAPNHLRFDRRHVIWLEARWDQLQLLPFTAVPVTELRRPQFVDTIQDLDVAEQMEWTDDLAGRITPAAATAPAVCLLDTGVRRTHVLLDASLAESDMHSIVGEPAGDLHGHGTLMAGLALIGPLDNALLGNDTTVTLRHRLESVKFLPDRSKPPHDPLAYGIVTAEAVARPAIAHARRRVFCMPITNPADRKGEPSLWSAAVARSPQAATSAGSDFGIELLGPPDPDCRGCSSFRPATSETDSTWSTGNSPTCPQSRIPPSPGTR